MTTIESHAGRCTASGRIADSHLSADSSAPATAGLLGNEGKLMMTSDRRALLRGLVATAAASAALTIPTAASSSAEPEAVVTAWRAWWANTVEWHRLAAESRRVWNSLPEEVQDPHVEIVAHPEDRKPKIARSIKEIELLTSPSQYLPMSDREKTRRAAVRAEKLSEFALRETEAQAAIVASGHRAIARRMDEIVRKSEATEAAIQASTSTTPAAIAARCHYALDGLAQHTPEGFIDGSPESRGLAFLIRDLMPQLPVDMAAAMAPVADGWRPLRDIWAAGAEVVS